MHASVSEGGGGGGGGGGWWQDSHAEYTFKGGEYWGIPQKNLDHLIRDFLCRLPLLGHSYILSPFHPYIAFMPVQFLTCIKYINYL